MIRQPLEGVAAKRTRILLPHVKPSGNAESLPHLNLDPPIYSVT
jgi:hypothetical protein